MTRADRLTQNTQAAEALAQAHAATHAGQDRRRATVRRARNAVLYRGRIAFAHAHAAQLGRLDAAHARARKLLQALATRRRRAATTRFSAGKRAAPGPHANVRALSVRVLTHARAARQGPGHRRIAHDEGGRGGGGRGGESDQPPSQQQQHKSGGQQDERDERNEHAKHGEHGGGQHDGLLIRSGSGAVLADWIVAALRTGNVATGTSASAVAPGADAHRALERAYCARLLDLLEPSDGPAAHRANARAGANGSVAPPDAAAPFRPPAPASISAPLLQLMLEARRAGAALGALADPALATVLQTLIDVAGARDASRRTRERSAAGLSAGPHDAHQHVNLLAGLILFSRHRPRPQRRGDNILLSLRDGASQRPRTAADDR